MVQNWSFGRDDMYEKKLGYIKKQQRNNSAIRINAQCTFISFDTQRKIFSASFARKDS